jgi:hypothetical protein
MPTPAQPPAPEFAGHTPGPWKAHGLCVYAPPSYNSPFGGRLRDFSNPIAQVMGDPLSADADLVSGTHVWREPGSNEAEANAALIAAAPQLLSDLNAERKWAKELQAALSQSLESERTLKAENAALRAALEAIASGSITDCGPNDLGIVRIDQEQMQAIARAALAFSARSQEVQS